MPGPLRLSLPPWLAPWSITNASGFVTRRSDDVVRGLGTAFANDKRLRVKLALL